jgi:hypothetical protein
MVSLRHSQEAIMPGSAIEESLHPSHTEEKPHPKSYDSSDECSLDHWLEVYWLVAEEYKFAKATESEN